MRTIFTNTLFLATLFLVSARAHDEHEDLRHWEIASADPDRIFLSFHGDPTTRRAVSWRTGGSRRTPAFAEIRKALGGPGFINKVSRLDAKTERVDLDDARKNEQGSVNYHFV